jgi:MarR family transcriptional regulator, organic hydroperoxide resistance regulator
MPVSRVHKRRMSSEVASYVAPPSVSVPSLLRGGNDRTFQKLVFDFFTISARIEQVRVHIASTTGISGPQYSVLRSVAALQGSEGVSIGVIAEHLQVTSTFITVQSGMLAQRGFMKKKEDTTDRRICRLSLTSKGERLVDGILNEVRPINDVFFGGLRRDEFDALSAIMEKLVDSSRAAVLQISSQDQQMVLSNRDKRIAGGNDYV